MDDEWFGWSPIGIAQLYNGTAIDIDLCYAVRHIYSTFVNHEPSGHG